MKVSTMIISTRIGILLGVIVSVANIILLRSFIIFLDPILLELICIIIVGIIISIRFGISTFKIIINMVSIMCELKEIF